MAMLFSQAKFRNLICKPKASRTLFRYRLHRLIPAPGTEYFLNIRASRSEAWNYVPEDHVYASMLSLKCLLKASLPLPKQIIFLHFRQKLLTKKLEVSGENMKITFDLAEGRMTSFNYKGKELMLKGPAPDFWRPPTDNDYGYNMDKLLGVWKKAGERTEVTKANISQPELG